MDLAERAFSARLHGDRELSVVLFQQAFQKERSAAEFIAYDFSYEPTRSILLRSAASLALDCGDSREAERLVALGLVGLRQRRLLTNCEISLNVSSSIATFNCAALFSNQRNFSSPWQGQRSALGSRRVMQLLIG